MNKRMRNKLRWNVTTHYNWRPWLTCECNQPKTRFNQLVRQATFGDMIASIHAGQARYRKIRVPGGIFIVEKYKFHNYVPQTNKPYYRGTTKRQFFTPNVQLEHYAKLRERYYSSKEVSHV